MHPVVLDLGIVKVYSYGLMLALGLAAGLWLAHYEARRRRLDAELVVEFALYGVLAGLVGARLMYVALGPGPYLREPLRILMVQEGGLSVHGAILGGLGVAWWFVRRRGLNYWRFADAFAPSLALGIGIARVGCFLNGCCYGVVTDGPWGALTRYAPGLRHPTQLYEMALSLALFGYLMLRRKRQRYEGELFLSFAAYYSVIRFGIEFFREVPHLYGYVTVTQVASVAVIALVAALGHRRQQAGQRSL